ncbi:hypothetical protein [Nostoc sp. WHI]|uniref:hypothetical protein n=1 Tax=Nostoc sp. WHI TaxID=2650611 RepID=UPI0018C52FA2|nr:hypothetical protein [Nostoc sp. WHI]MBG1268113.1 hypothetical protein [Nostoc sp. WHI]
MVVDFMLKQKRNRQSRALSIQGQENVRLALQSSGLTYIGWSMRCNTYISESTIKRFIAGIPVSTSYFNELLTALNLTIEDSYIVPKINSIGSSQLAIGLNISQLAIEKNTISSFQGGMFMTATFTEDKRSEIERIIRHLQSFLIGSKIKFHDDKGVVRVSGNFSEYEKLHIDATIDELEELCTSLKVTW